MGCGAAGGPRLRGPGLLYVFPAVVMIISIAVAIAAAVSSASSVPMGVAAMGAEMTSTSQLQLQLQMYNMLSFLAAVACTLEIKCICTSYSGEFKVQSVLILSTHLQKVF